MKKKKSLGVPGVDGYISINQVVPETMKMVHYDEIEYINGEPCISLDVLRRVEQRWFFEKPNNDWTLPDGTTYDKFEELLEEYEDLLIDDENDEFDN